MFYVFLSSFSYGQKTVYLTEIEEDASKLNYYEKVKLINTLTDETNESVENIKWDDISFETIIEGDPELKSYNKRDYLWFANRTSSSSVQYMPDEILKPKNYRKYKDRQNR